MSNESHREVTFETPCPRCTTAIQPTARPSNSDPNSQPQ